MSCPLPEAEWRDKSAPAMSLAGAFFEARCAGADEMSTLPPAGRVPRYAVLWIQAAKATPKPAR